MKVVVKPRSDQWNADDFISGPRTFTIEGVKEGTAEAPYDIQLFEGEGRVWRPPNGMLAVLIHLWGSDSKQWVGRRVTLFRDPSVRFGKEVPGGIRISHMSDIGPKGASPNIRVSRGQMRPYPVKPLLQDAPAPTQSAPNEIPADVKANVEKAKQDGNLPAYLDYLIEREAPTNIINYVKEQA